MEIDVGITHSRHTLGIAYRHVTTVNEPIIVRRYGCADAILVLLGE